MSRVASQGSAVTARMCPARLVKLGLVLLMLVPVCRGMAGGARYVAVSFGAERQGEAGGVWHVTFTLGLSRSGSSWQARLVGVVRGVVLRGYARRGQAG